MALKPGPLRDAVVLLVVFGVLLGGLYVYTQTWPPAVIVESSSMMHRDAEVRYGRIGTIDPGDLVLVKKVKGVDHRRQGMNCPQDGTTLLMSERSGVEIDYCPQCRGVWLDRGELDKIIERGERDDDLPPMRGEREPLKYERAPGHKKKKNWLSEVFEFGD